MKRTLAITSLLVALAALAWVDRAARSAEPINSADAEAIHAVVQSQLDAFAKDDAETAFELASPDTRVKFGSPYNFLQLIKLHYNPIYRHRLALFSDPEVIDGATIQVVRLTDGDNQVWLAIYRMRSDPGGAWKVDDCQLLRTTSIAT